MRYALDRGMGNTTKSPTMETRRALAEMHTSADTLAALRTLRALHDSNTLIWTLVRK